MDATKKTKKELLALIDDTRTGLEAAQEAGDEQLAAALSMEVQAYEAALDQLGKKGDEEENVITCLQTFSADVALAIMERISEATDETFSVIVDGVFMEGGLSLTAAQHYAIDPGSSATFVNELTGIATTCHNVVSPTAITNIYTGIQ